MITLFGKSYAWNAPEVLLIAAAAAILLAFLVLILRAASRASASAAPLMREVAWLSHKVQSMGESQERLAGGLTHVSEA